MLYDGKKFEAPNIEIIVIPRNDKNIIIKAQAVLDYTEHDALNPRPEPRKLVRPGNIVTEDVTNPEYQKALSEWGRKKLDWMVIKSLSATENLTWEKIKIDDPNTWHLYKEELEEAYFNPQEIMRIMDCVFNANGLNQSKIDEATKSFLAGQVALNQ